MKLIIAINCTDYHDKSSWPFYVACKTASEIGAELCRIYIVNSQPSNWNENWLKSVHYSLERKFSRVSQLCDQSEMPKVIDDFVNVGDDEVVCNLSCLSDKDLRKVFPTQRIWTVRYHNEPIQNFRHIGESEIIEKKSSIVVSLVELNNKEFNVVDDAFYNLHYSAIRNFQNIVYTIHLLLAKNIKGYLSLQRTMVVNKVGGGGIIGLTFSTSIRGLLGIS